MKKSESRKRCAAARGEGGCTMKRLTAAAAAASRAERPISRHRFWVKGRPRRCLARCYTPPGIHGQAGLKGAVVSEWDWFQLRAWTRHVAPTRSPRHAL